MLVGPSIDVFWGGGIANGGNVVEHSATRRRQENDPTQTAPVRSLTGIRAAAALLVVGTHAAYATGKETQTHGYVGLLYSRLEIGVPIFFVLSGFLLFSPWVKAAANGSTPPRVRRYVRRRVRRIMPAYVVIVLLAFLFYQFHSDGPNPGQTWIGLFRYLTLTQIYTANYMLSYQHQGLTQMWSLAVEVAFYAALPPLLATRTAAGRLGRVGRAYSGLADRAAHLRLVAERGRHVVACQPRVLRRRNGVGGAAGHGGALLCVCGDSVGAGQLPDRGYSHRGGCGPVAGQGVGAAG